MSARGELLKLVARDGIITPASVLEAATPEDSVLHSMFEWDDTEAAHRFRLVQAQRIIRRFKIVVHCPPDVTVRVRQFVSVPGEDGRFGYVPTAEALTSPRTHDIVLQQALREVAGLRRKYQNLLDFDAVLAKSMRRDESAAS